MREPMFECPSCHDCYTADQWNEHNKIAIVILGMVPMPEGIEDGSSFDCPSCGERSWCEDMEQYL